jgi:hypothetical protein
MTEPPRDPYDRYRPQEPVSAPAEPRWTPNEGNAVQPAQRFSPPESARAAYPEPARQAAGKRYGLRGAEPFWYVLGCIGFGAAYFSKLPAKKATCEIVSELQLDGHGPSQGYVMSSMATFWYYTMCIAFGGGYFAKVSAKKAMWEVVSVVQSSPGEYTAAMRRALS